MSHEDELTPETHPLLAEFRDTVCAHSRQIDADEALDWKALSIGWFLAKGLDVDDAVYYALAARYKYHYWQ